MHTSKITLEKLLDSIIKVVSRGTSEKYAVMVIKKFINKHKSSYEFLNYVDISGNTHESIKIDDQINTAEPKEVGKFIEEMINSLFSDLFKQLLSREISSELLVDLKMLGVDLEI